MCSNYGWVLGDVKQCKGALRLWNVPPGDQATVASCESQRITGHSGLPDSEGQLSNTWRVPDDQDEIGLLTHKSKKRRARYLDDANTGSRSAEVAGITSGWRILGRVKSC
jgi:hypothetical protein